MPTRMATPVPNPSLAVDPSYGMPGDVVTIRGSNFPALAKVSKMEIGGIQVLPPSQVTTAQDGSFSATVTIVGLDYGRYLFSVVVGGHTSNTNFTISLEAPAAASTPLPTPIQSPSRTPTPSPTHAPTPARTPDSATAPTSELPSSKLDLPWQRDGISQNEELALGIIELMEEWGDPRTVEIILGAEWFEDGISIEDVTVLSTLYRISPYDAVGSMVLAHYLGTLKEINRNEWETADDFAFYTLENQPLPQFLIEIPWVTDGVSPEELESVEVFVTLADANMSLAQRLLDTTWISDGISKGENEVIEVVSNMAGIDSSLAERLLGLGWIADGVDERELAAIDFVLTKRALYLGKNIDAGRWYSSGRTGIRQAILAMESTLDLDELLLNSTSVESMLSMVIPARDQLRELTSQSWFQDGLTNEEKALVVAVRSVAGDPEMEDTFQEIVNDHNMLSTTFTLSSAGEINLYVVSRSSLDLNDEVLKVMENGVKSISSLLREPWNRPHVIVLLEPDYTEFRAGEAGIYTGSHMVIKFHSKHLIYHELGHYYFNNETSPSWFHEGTADFLADYTLSPEGPPTIQSRYSTVRNDASRKCSPYGVATIQDWILATAGQTYDQVRETEIHPCQYPLGESFLLRIYDKLGHEVVSASLRQLYLMAQANGHPVNERDIYQVFFNNAPSGKQSEFQDIYRSLHGGPMP